jgi:hypothetical protein
MAKTDKQKDDDLEFIQSNFHKLSLFDQYYLVCLVYYFVLRRKLQFAWIKFVLGQK